MCEAGEARQATLFPLPLPLLLFPLLLPSPVLLEKLQFAVDFLSSLPSPKEGIIIYFFFLDDQKICYKPWTNIQLHLNRYTIDDLYFLQRAPKI